MTALAIKTQNFFAKILNSLIEARSRQAEYEVARMLQREYPKESLSHIMEMIRLGKFKEIER
jgi:hypothetical protein